MAFTIKPELYVGRTFSPIVETTFTKGGGPVNTPSHPEGANELVCVTFVAPTKLGSTVNLTANANPNDGWNVANNVAHGMACMVSITEKNGDFSYNAAVGTTSGSIQGIVGPATRTQLGLEPGKTYIANAAPKDRDAKPGMRVQLTIG